MKAIFPIIGLLLGIVTCGWDNPHLIKKEGVIYAPSLYTDKSTGNTYAFYSLSKNTGEHFICFSLFTKKDTTITEQCIKQKIRVLDVSIAGAENGADLFLAFSARRTLNGIKCDKSVQDGCIDVYFIESKNSGINWTEPVVVPRPNLKDACYRNFPHILFISETGRLIITYVVTAQGYRYMDFSLISRPKDSLIFTNEKVYSKPYDNQVLDVSIVYTHVKNVTVVHTIVGFGGFYEYCQCSVAGELIFGAVLRSGETGRYTFSASSSCTKDEVYMVSLAQNNVFMLHWVTSDMKLHSKTIKYTKPINLFYPMIQGVPNQNRSFIFTGVIDKEEVSTYAFNTENQKIKDLEDTAPATMTASSIAMEYGDGMRIRSFNKIGNDLYLSTYTHVDINKN